MFTSHVRAIACVLAAVLGAAVVAGCKTDASTVTTAAAGTSTAKAGSSKPAGLGSTIDLTDDEGDRLAVTVTAVDPKAAATDQFSTPDAGDQYYAAQLEIKNIGTSSYSDAPDNCLVVKDARSQQFQTTIVESISSGPLMGDTVNLAPGDSSLGWVVFEVPTGDKITTVQFTTDSGMGSDTGQWAVS